jgi:p-hydroxybenzoate 3-monooxygenase
VPPKRRELSGLARRQRLLLLLGGNSRERPPAGGPSGEYVKVLAPQQALVRNLVAAFLDDGGDLRFEVADVAMSGLGSQRPIVSYTDGECIAHEIACDLIAGCDGDHGVSRGSVPGSVLTAYTRDYGVTWLAVLADTPVPRYPCFGIGVRGYAAGFSRSPKTARFYLEIPASDT